MKIRERGATLPFRVVHASSQTELHPPSALEVQAHAYNTDTNDLLGWCSARKCSYPQEIGIELKSKARIHTLEILSHESRVTEKVSIYVALRTTETRGKRASVEVRPYNDRADSRSDLSARVLLCALLMNICTSTGGTQAV